MMSNTRLFRRSDPDFPTTRAAQRRLIAARGKKEVNLLPSGSAPRKGQAGRRVAPLRGALPGWPREGVSARKQEIPHARER